MRDAAKLLDAHSARLTPAEAMVSLLLRLFQRFSFQQVCALALFCAARRPLTVVDLAPARMAKSCACRCVNLFLREGLVARVPQTAHNVPRSFLPTRAAFAALCLSSSIQNPAPNQHTHERTLH